MIGNIASNRWMATPWRRRTVFAAAALVLGMASVFPQQYRAAVTLTPTDPSSLGLSGALGQLGAFASAFGNQAAIEISLKVARSQDVRKIVVQKLDLVHRLHFADDREADRWLTREVDIRVLRGGIIQVEIENGNPKLGLEITAAFSNAIRQRLGEIARNQTAYKRGVLLDLLERSKIRLARAQEAYDAFRRTTHYSEPTSAIGAIGSRIPMLEAQLRGKAIELETARAFATDNNMSVRQIIAEIGILKQQLQEAKNLNPDNPDSVNRVVVQTTYVQNLQRELNVSQNLYDNYKRFLEGTETEDIASTGNVRVLEPPYIDTERQFRALPASLFLIVLLIALLTELYMLRPPIFFTAVWDRTNRE